jgi:hypothetical protein
MTVSEYKELRLTSIREILFLMGWDTSTDDLVEIVRNVEIVRSGRLFYEHIHPAENVF